MLSKTRSISMNFNIEKEVEALVLFFIRPL